MATLRELPEDCPVRTNGTIWLRQISLGNIITIAVLVVGIILAFAKMQMQMATVPTAQERKAEIRDEIASADSTLLYRLNRVEDTVNSTANKVDQLKETIDLQGGRLAEQTGKIERKLNRVLEAK